jgi:hypothetical protein
MIVLEVMHNGKLVARAGRDDLCVLNTIVDAVGVLGKKSVGTKDEKDSFHFHLHVGGMSATSDEDTGKHYHWISTKEVALGDEISIRIIESASADPAVKEQPVDKKEVADQQRRTWEAAKEYYQNYRDRYENE